MLFSVNILHKYFKNIITFYLLIFLCLFGSNLHGQANLLINPGAESGDPTGAGGGWTPVAEGAIQGPGDPTAGCYGSSNWRMTGNHDGFPVVHGGTYMFYPGCATN